MQRQFAYLAHGIAVVLKNKYDITDFCGYVSQRPSFEFLQNQKEIKYTKLILDEDIHKEYEHEPIDLAYLRRLENEYGLPNLWPYLAVDRVLMFNQLVREYPYNTPPYSYEEMLRILQVKAKRIIEFLDKEKPDFLFLSVIGSVGSYLLYSFAKKRGIKTYIVQLTTIKNQYICTEDYRYFTGVQELLQNQKEINIKPESIKQATSFIKEFRRTPHPYYDDSSPTKQHVRRLQQFSFLRPRNLLKILLFLKNYFYQHYHNGESADYSYIGPWNYLRDGIIRKIRNLRGVDDLYDAFDHKKKYAFFPLHYEPEIALLLQAPFMTDQIHTIKQIARSLPVGYYLYVKEHPQMVIFRPRSYYKELKKIPNVRLLNPSIPSFPITQAAELITTITGSVGWEAIIFGKPVITFGDTFYNKLTFVKNCSTFAELPNMIKYQLEEYRYDEDELIKFIAAIFQDSAHINLHDLWQKETSLEKRIKGIVPLADLLADKLGLKRQV